MASPAVSAWAAATTRGANRCSSPSARKRARPGSGSRGSRTWTGAEPWSRGALRSRRGGLRLPPRRQRRLRTPPRRSCRPGSRGRAGASASSRNPTPPSQPGAAGKQRAMTSGARSSVSKNAPPAYEATALIPIRAIVLRSPASNASRRRPTAPATSMSSAPRVPATSAASRIASHGWTARAPAAIAMASAWTSRMSAASRTMSVRPRRPASVNAACTAPAASTDGTGRRPGSGTRSDTSTATAPVRAAPTAASASRDNAASSPSGPASARPGRIERDHAPRAEATQRARRPGRSATIGRLSRIDRPRRRRPAEQRRAPPDMDPEIDDEPLPLGVDRRVRDLGERLLEMIGGSSLDAAVTGRRRVVAHAPERLVTLARHRPDVEPEALGIESRQVPATGRGVVRAEVVDRARQLVLEGGARQLVRDPGPRQRAGRRTN